MIVWIGMLEGGPDQVAPRCRFNEQLFCHQFLQQTIYAMQIHWYRSLSHTHLRIGSTAFCSQQGHEQNARGYQQSCHMTQLPMRNSVRVYAFWCGRN
jgi:hypothetical protein